MAATRKKRGGRRPPVATSRTAAAGFGWLLAAALVAIAIAYLPSHGVPYLYDDHDAIETNPALREPGTLRWLYEVPENSTLIGRPVLSWSFGWNALLLGHEPRVYHVFNLLVHLGNAILVALLARRGLAYGGVSDPLRSAAAVAIAFVWGLHPLNVQAVAYLIQRGESLATLFELFTLYAWLRVVEDGSGRGWRWSSYAAPVLAAATKEHGWIAPLLPLLWAWVFHARAPLAEVRARPLFYAVGAASWLLLAVLTWRGGRLEHLAAEPEIDAWTYLVTQPEVLTHYLRLFFLPVGQSFDYDWPPARLATAWPFLLIWTAAFAAACYAIVKRLPAGFPAGLFFLSLATSSSFLPLPDLAVEHRFYLAGACVAALVVGGGLQLARHGGRVPARAAWAALLCVGIVLGASTWRRATLFQSEFAVWSEAVERNPAQRRALSNLGGLLLAQKKPNEALAAFRRIEELGIPDRMQTRIRYQIGNALFDLGRYADARGYYRKALETVNGDPGSIYTNLGHTYLQDGQPEEARRMFERALATLADDAQLHLDLAFACLESADVDCAGRAYRRGIQLGGRPQPRLRQAMAVLRPDLAGP